MFLGIAVGLLILAFTLFLLAVTGSYAWMVGTVACLLLSAPFFYLDYQENAEKVENQRNACVAAEQIWVADRQVCVTPEGWVVSPK